MGHPHESFKEGGAEIVPLGKMIHTAHVHQLRQQWQENVVPHGHGCLCSGVGVGTIVQAAQFLQQINASIGTLSRDDAITTPPPLFSLGAKLPQLYNCELVCGGWFLAHTILSLNSFRVTGWSVEG